MVRPPVRQSGDITPGHAAIWTTEGVIQDGGSPGYLITATGGDTARNLPDHFNDILNVKDFGATGDGVTDDTNAIQAAIAYCFGPPDNPHGENSYLNTPLRFPPGKYIISSPLLITKLQGGMIIGSGRLTTLIENVTGGASTGDVIRANGIEYSTIRDIAFLCHEDGICLDLDYDGSGGGVSLQANTLENTLCSGNSEAGTTGVRIGHSQFQGSEFVFLQHHNQGCMTAGVIIENPNSLQHQFYGGQDQGCSIGIWITTGSAPVINGRGFQEQVTCDIQIDEQSHNCMNVTGCRSESETFIMNDAGQMMDISACLHTSTIGYFLRSLGGFINIRSCETYAFVGFQRGCNATLENCYIHQGIFGSNMWFSPSEFEPYKWNVFVRNVLFDDEMDPLIPTQITSQRWYSTDGDNITKKEAVYS